MRELAAELVPEVFTGDYPYRIHGVFTGLSNIVLIPKKDDLLRAMKSSEWDLRITSEEFTAVENSEFLDNADHINFYASAIKRSPGAIYDFLRVYRWGGEELVTAAYADKGLLAFDVLNHDGIQNLLESDWGMDEPMSMNELSLIGLVSSEYLPKFHDQDEPFTAAEYLHVIRNDRAAISRAYRKRVTEGTHKVGFIQDAIEVIQAFRKINGDNRSLERLLTLERYEWYTEDENEKYRLIADVAASTRML